MIIVFLIGLLSAASYYFIKFYRRQAHIEKHLKGIKGPKPVFLVGNALEFKSSDDFLPTLWRLTKEYDGLTKLYIGVEANLLVADYKTFEFILSSNKILDKSNVYRYLYRWIGTGLLTASSEKWRKHRKIITPTFHFQILEQFVEIFEKNSNILVEKLEPEVRKEQTNLCPFITLCALDIICETAMGTSVNAQNDSESEYVKCVKEMCRIISERALSPLQQYEFCYFLFQNYWIEKRSLKVLHNYTNTVIKRKKEEMARKKDTPEEKKDSTGIKKKQAFLDLLLECNVTKNVLSDTEIEEEVNTFMFEGHDTTSSGMSFALYCLAYNEDVQNKVVSEQRDIFMNDPNRPVTFRDLQDMKYLEMVIKETLRMFPSVPYYARKTVEDVPYDGGILPKGLPIILFAYGIHHNPKYFPDPENFNPGRFSSDNQGDKKPYSYLPFSAGPRNCIGQKYAMLEMKSTISKVIRNFVLTPIPGFEPILLSETVLKSKNGIQVKMEKRKW